MLLPDAGYLSDPDLVFVPELGELWLYYRQVTEDDLVLLVRSTDGIVWSAPGGGGPVAEPPAGLAERRAARAQGDWWMFTVNAGISGCDATPHGRRGASLHGRPIHWGAPVSSNLGRPGSWAWHVDVQWIPSQGVFWALYNAKSAGGCTTPAVYLAESADGLHWTDHEPAGPGKGSDSASFTDIVYRSTFDYDPASDAADLLVLGRALRRPAATSGARRSSAGAGPRVFTGTRPWMDPDRASRRPRLRSTTGPSRFPAMTSLPDRFAGDPRAASGVPDAALIERESRLVSELMTELGRVIVGQRAMLERLLIGLLADGHVLLEGVPGLAKTLVGAHAGRRDRRRLPPHPVHPRPAPGRPDRHDDLQPAERRLHGAEGADLHQPAAGGRDQPRPGQGAERAARGDAGEAGDDRRARTFPLPELFLVLATQNPIEHEGTYPLPEAQVDRFMFKLVVTYPERREEREVLDRMTAVDEPAARPAARPGAGAPRPAALVQAVYADERIKEYVLDLVGATRRPAGGAGSASWRR